MFIGFLVSVKRWSGYITPRILYFPFWVLWKSYRHIFYAFHSYINTADNICPLNLTENVKYSFYCSSKLVKRNEHYNLSILTFWAIFWPNWLAHKIYYYIFWTNPFFIYKKLKFVIDFELEPLFRLLIDNLLLNL